MELMLAVMDNFPLSINAYDENGRLLLANKETKKLLGYDTENWIGKNRREILNFILDPYCLEALDLIEPTGDSNCIEHFVLFKNKDGELQPGKIITCKLRDKAGKIKGFLDLNFDISIIKNRDESTSMIEIILESIDVGILAVDNNLVVTNFNKQAEKIIGKTKEEVVNRHIKYLYPNDPYEYQFIQRTIIEGKEFKNTEEIVEVNGKTLELIVDTNLLRDKDSKTVGAVCICKDITDFKRMEKEIEENERLKLLNELSAGVAHEIRNPLAGIKGFLQLLENNYRKEIMTEKNLFYIQSILEEVDRINSITKDFLLLNKNMETTKTKININQLIESVLSLMEPLSLQKSIKVEKKLDYSLTKVHGHSEHLKQVFINLIKNSIEALKVGGGIIVQTSPKDGGIEVGIIDDGPGIPPEIIDKIIYPFFTTKMEGTGLGLSICKKIIRDHGGRMIIENIAGSGAAVRVYLPTDE